MGVWTLILLILTNSEIGDILPNRSIASMQVSYNRLKAMVETFTNVDVSDYIT